MLQKIQDALEVVRDVSHDQFFPFFLVFPVVLPHIPCNSLIPVISRLLGLVMNLSTTTRRCHASFDLYQDVCNTLHQYLSRCMTDMIDMTGKKRSDMERLFSAAHPSVEKKRPSTFQNMEIATRHGLKSQISGARNPPRYVAGLKRTKEWVSCRTRSSTVL